jgi:hypothetical protein
MKFTIILSSLINLIQLNNISAFSHYKFYDLKSITDCPYTKKYLNKCNINDINQETTFYKKNILITYPSWKPKEKNYNPRKVDWSSVISGCHAACNFDKRLCNFYVRASAHDSLSISEGYGGTDGSMLITEDELSRPENNYDSFAFKLSKNALALAKRYDTSVADIISVCGAYAVKYLGGIDIIKSSSIKEPFLVGRKDSTIPNPGHQLVPENANTSMFNDFSIKYGFSLNEFTALLGSHALLDEKECLNKDRQSYCDPLLNKCDNISMFNWDNSYYQDLCSKNISIKFNTIPVEFIKTKKQLIRNELCKFTSDYFREEIKEDINKELDIEVENIILQDIIQETNDLLVELENQHVKQINVNYYDGNEIKKWLYTTNDAWLGLACQNKLEDTNYNNEIRNSMNLFKSSTNEWQKIYMKAYKKMINNNVRWFNLKTNGLRITGNECNSGYRIYKNKRLCKGAFNPDDKFYY